MAIAKLIADVNQLAAEMQDESEGTDDVLHRTRATTIAIEEHCEGVVLH